MLLTQTYGCHHVVLALTIWDWNRTCIIIGCICPVWFSTLYFLAAECQGWLFRSFIPQIFHYFNPSRDVLSQSCSWIPISRSPNLLEVPRNHETDLTQADPPKRPGAAQRSSWKNSSKGNTVEELHWMFIALRELLKLVIKASTHWWIRVNALHVHMWQLQEMVDLLVVGPTQSPTWNVRANNPHYWSVGIAILWCDDISWKQWA